MRKALILVIVASALLAACATGPEPLVPPDEAYDTARLLRAQILEFELAQHAQSMFEAGEAQFNTAVAAYDEEDYETAAEVFDLAIDSYTIVLRDGFRAVAIARQEEATAEKTRAESARADVAVPEQYGRALEVYNDGIRAMDTGDNQGAAELFETAAGMFAEAWRLAVSRRREAEEAVRRAERRIQELEEQRETLEEEAREDLAEEEDDDSAEADE